MDIPTGYAQVNFVFTGDGLPTGAEVTLGLDISDYSTDPSGIPQSIADAVGGTAIQTCWAETITLSLIKVKIGPTDTGPTYELVQEFEGERSGEQLQPGTATLIRKITGVGGRAGRGRMYWPGPVEEDVTAAGNFTSGALNEWQTNFDSFYDDLVGSDLLPVLLHGEDSPVSTPTPITNFVVDGKVATQRRRLRR